MAWSKESRHARGYGTAWDKLRKRILTRDCGVCQCDDCKKAGRVRIATEVDHRIPKSKGGTDDEDNLQAINAECHKAKTAKDNGAAERTQFDARGRVVW